MNKTIRKKTFAILTVFVLLGVLLPQVSALALIYSNPMSSGAKSSGTGGAESTGQATTESSATLIGVTGQIIQWAAGQLTYWLNNQQLALGEIKMVKDSWTILRDFVNMFFILFLIIMAFGTIFNVSGFRYNELLPKFLIAALLINFSFTIGQYVISLGNGLAQVFLNQLFC